MKTQQHSIKMMSVAVTTAMSTVFVLLAVCCISTAEAETGPRDMFVFDLINQFRAAPFDHAVSLGYAPAVLQEKGIGPETVFAPYVLDEGLSIAAEDANFPVVAVDPEAQTILPVHARTTQTSSVFSFFYFIPMETAARVFVENLFKNELDSGVFQFILSREYWYAGTAVDPGVVAETRMNAWFLSLALGSLEKVTEMRMLNLINQVRAYPFLTQFFLHPDVSSQLFQQNPNINEVPKMQFSPLFPDGALQRWALADAALSGKAQEDVSGVAEADVALVSSDPVVSQPTDFYESYPGEFFQAATVAASWQDMTVARPVADLFSALLYSELTTWPYGAVVFTNRYTQAGVAITLETLENSGAGVVSVYAGYDVDWSLVPQEREQPAPEQALNPTEEILRARVYGLVYFNQDEDLIYSPGEEIAGQTVFVYELTPDPLTPLDASPALVKTLVQTVVTDNVGHFSLSLAPGRQWVFEAEKDGQVVSSGGLAIEKDQFVKMVFVPEYPVVGAP